MLRKLLLLLTGTASLTCISNTNAQVTYHAADAGWSDHGVEAYNSVPTALGEHIEAIAGPPAGFNPLTASASDLNKYGIPPRPDAVVHPKAFAVWQKAVSHDQERILGEVGTGSFVHKPAQITGKATDQTKADYNSTNWSGPVIYDPNNAFAVCSIMGFWHVPIAQHAFGRPRPGLDVSAQWVGIDGAFGSSDVFQAGTECNVSWSGNEVNEPSYSFWFEWYPFNEHPIPLKVTAGDIVFVDVWNISPTLGYAYFVNLSTNRAAAYRFGAPAGYYLVGNTAEWIVEQPGYSLNGRPLVTNLTNYVGQAFAFCTASSPIGEFNPGANLDPYTPNPGSGATYLFQMVNNSGELVSQTYLAGSQSIWFWDEGPAR